MGKQKQKFHLEPDRGLLNDPNGLAYYKGTYYVFFQWNRFAKDHSYKEWGLFKSPDLLHWKFQGSALLPDQVYDKDGVYSGSSCIIDNKLYLFYTGNTKTKGIRKSYQCLASTEDGRKFLKYGPVLETPDEYTENFRDPKVFRGKKRDYFMVIGAQKMDGKGAIALAVSRDGLHWKVKSNLAETSQYEMIECPDLFELDGHHVLIYGLQERDNIKDECGISFAAYKITAFDEAAETLDDSDLDQYALFDQGFDFYAPQTFQDEKGRRILFAWMSRMDAAEEQAFSKNEKNIHCMTLPRELRVKNGKLYQTVPEEYEQLKGRQILPEPFGEQSETGKKVVFSGRTSFIRLSGAELGRGFSVRFPKDRTSVSYNSREKTFSLKRYNRAKKRDEEKCFHLASLDSIEMWLDTSSIEIFINSGEYVLSSRIYAECLTQEAVFEGTDSHVAIECRELSYNRE